MPLIKPAHLTSWQWMVERFWRGVDKQGPDECWPWTRACVTDGYGTISLVKGTPYATHRLSYSINKGLIPRGMQVLHSCDNPPCCNPAHLFLGTNTDNQKDRTRKLRGSAKLTDAQVNEIRSTNDNQKQTAKRFGITQSMVSRLRARNRRA